MANLIKQKIEQIFCADLRSLALMRIGVSILLLIDLYFRSTFISDFYTDNGVLPLDIFFKTNEWYSWSLHALNGSLIFEIFLFLLSAMFAVLLLMGYKTKLVTIVCFILLLSLHHRNPIILNRGDVLLRLALFWGVFLPWGARFSVDSIKNQILNKLPNRAFSVGILGYFLQVVFLYFFSAALKTGSEWTKDFTAIYYALNIDLYATPLARFLLGFPQVLTFATYSVRLIEILAPLLLLFPFYLPIVRMATIVVLIVMHFFFGASMFIGLFFLIDIVVLFGLIPSVFWDKLHTFQPLSKIAAKLNSFFSVRKSKIKQNDQTYDFSIPLNIIALFFVIYIFLWQAGDFSTKVAIPQQLRWVGYVFGVNQRWNMFAPRPLKDDGWYVIIGTLSDRTSVNLLSSKAQVFWEKPRNLALTFENYEWRNFLSNLWVFAHVYNYKVEYYGDYLCRKWNSNSNTKLKSIDINFVVEKTPPPSSPSSTPYVDKLLDEYSCTTESIDI